MRSNGRNKRHGSTGQLDIGVGHKRETGSKEWARSGTPAQIVTKGLCHINALPVETRFWSRQRNQRSSKHIYHSDALAPPKLTSWHFLNKKKVLDMVNANAWRENSPCASLRRSSANPRNLVVVWGMRGGLTARQVSWGGGRSWRARERGWLTCKPSRWVRRWRERSRRQVNWGTCGGVTWRWRPGSQSQKSWGMCRGWSW